MLSTIKSFVCTKDTPIANTKAGKLRGMIIDGIYTFRGIQYATAERFMPPKPVQPWEGIVDCQDYGYVAPLIKQPRFRGDAVMLHRFWTSSEDCLYLNVWTDKMDPAAKKPVMVWLHGGGFSMGSSNEMYSYEGENMTRDKGVVMVSLNHRLSILGYLDLSEYGPAYAHSGNVGMEDIVEALRWVKENIAQFGGDPDNVTIFGQSGGGGKVQTLMQMASADGLYHRAIIMSGVLKFTNNRKAHAQLTAKKIVEKMGGLEAVKTKDFFYLAEAAAAVEAEGFAINWAPVPNGDDYIGGWDEVGFRPEAAHIPVIAGTVINEFFFDTSVADKAAFTEEELLSVVSQRYGEEDAAKAIRLFRETYPGIPAYYVKGVDERFRVPTLQFVDARMKATDAPVYNYITAHESAYKGGRLTNHNDDLPFVFRNEGGYGALHHRDAAKDTKIKEELSGSWAAFAATGDPNHPTIGRWEPCSPGNHATFVFCDGASQTRINHDAQLLALAQKHPLKVDLAKIMKR